MSSEHRCSWPKSARESLATLYELLDGQTVSVHIDLHIQHFIPLSLLRGSVHTVSWEKVTMLQRAPPTLLLAAASLHGAAAHSHIDYVLVNGVSYAGFIPQLGSRNPADVVGWSTTATDDGFVPPANYTTPDIVCHRDGSPPRAHVPVAPGDTMHFQWNGWPESHDGPVQTYLAPCYHYDDNTTTSSADDGCASVDKTRLAFAKIDDSAPALLNETGGPPGVWATEVLIASNNSWLVEVPAGLAPGPYVLRHEIIALHYANRTGGAQNYPQCFNIWVTGDDGAANATSKRAGWSVGGTTGVPDVREHVEGWEGVLATEMYHADDPGILIDIYRNLTTYDIPGPTLAADAVPIPMSSQTNMLSRAAGTPVLVTGTATMPFPQSSATGVGSR